MLSRKLKTKKVLLIAMTMVYIILLIFALFNYNSRIRFQMPITFEDRHSSDETAMNRCRVQLDTLRVQEVDIFDRPSLSSIEDRNAHLKPGGTWAPSDCQSWQKVALIIPYRDRWTHLKLLLKRLHAMLKTQKIEYRIFVIEQFRQEKFNRGRLMNIGFTEALKLEKYDCFIFHDVDLIPENDRNLYYCDDQARHLSSAIDEMRYHVMYYNYAGGVIAINRSNMYRINGYSNHYWGSGSEDDDLSARTAAGGLLLSRPPEHIGRYKMVRHTKSLRTTEGYDLFLQWKSRWKTDGINSLERIGYKVISKTEEKLYTNITVDVGQPPKEEEVESLKDTGPRVSFIEFIMFYFP